MDAGYEPGRLMQLLHRTVEAIDTLSDLTSSDPAATEAIRTIRLTRRNLEDHWMPALRDIEHSDTMVRWRASRLRTFGFRHLGALGEPLPDHLQPSGTAAVPIPVERRNELLGRLDFLERKAMTADADAANQGQSCRGPDEGRAR